MSKTFLIDMLMSKKSLLFKKKSKKKIDNNISNCFKVVLNNNKYDDGE